MRLAASAAALLVAAAPAAADGPPPFRPKIQSARQLTAMPERRAASPPAATESLLKEIGRLTLENARLAEENRQLAAALQAARTAVPGPPRAAAVYKAADAATSSSAVQLWLPRWGRMVPGVRREDGRWEVKAEGGGVLLLDEKDVVPQ